MEIILKGQMLTEDTSTAEAEVHIQKHRYHRFLDHFTVVSLPAEAGPIQTLRQDPIRAIPLQASSFRYVHSHLVLTCVSRSKLGSMLCTQISKSTFSEYRGSLIRLRMLSIVTTRTFISQRLDLLVLRVFTLVFYMI